MVQAALADRHFSADPYADEQQLVNAQFERFPEQRALYDAAVTALAATPRPCRTYLPVYRDGGIVVSFKPTARGLYAALNLVSRETWPERVAHNRSLGGSARLKDGVYLSTHAELKQLMRELGARARRPS